MYRSLISLALIFAFVVPTSAYAAPEEDFEVAGWIPYWAVSKGTKSARDNIETLSAILPFTYSVGTDGKVKDLGGMSKSAWKRLLKDAEKNDVRVTPTIMWSDTANIHTILSDSKKRAAHIKSIVDMVEKGDYDGIDIDYENKRASTRTYYSLFLKELKDELDGGFLSCTIEARTPPESLYVTIPTTLEYANDFKEINKYCDRVNIMAYDQQRADLKLNAARTGVPYYPVADTDWVKKVMQLTAKDIDKDKLTIGVATYGREVEVTVSPNWFQSYNQLWSVNPEYALDTAKDFKVKPSTNKAGEQSYTYVAKKSPVKLSAFPKAPSGTASGDEVALRALAYANKTGDTVTINMVSWSDAKAVEEKVDLARELGLRGVTIFKIDGGEDEGIWDIF